ncbi:MAG: S8 family peptidase [candidate division KSB1 bacterium]|nr:S8 family peptidase [candidate division KSB1 bacterium]MDZ7369215.1 S8 family peptidase [candidate division KSB1 bacterium]MDZ7407207.1 S8 family peptidase [candidate division KSB1 bacterium]
MIKFIKCAEPAECEDLEKALESSGVKVLKKYKLTGVFKIEVPDEHPTLLQETKQLSKKNLQKAVKGLTVTEVYDDFPVQALLDQAVPRTNVDLVWKRRKNEGEDMIIGICDTGVDVTHGDLLGRILGTADFTGEGDFDGNGHGTHVATIAVGDGSRSNGKYRGVAPKAKLYMAKGLNSAGQGSASSIADGIEWLYEKGVHVISLSLGGTAQAGVKDILQVTCEAVIDAGVAVFCAAGNSGPGARTIATPGVSPKVITVGASDDHDRVADFSSRGPTVDGYEKPDIVAPGVDIIAGRSKNTALGRVIDDYYVELSGTSMATPFAAGVGLLILKEKNNLKPDELKAALENSALDLKTGNDNIEGEGRIDAYAAITGGSPRPAPEVPIDAPEPACLLTRIFGSSKAATAVLYFTRDRMLAPLPGGKWMIARYYQLSRFILRHWKLQPALNQ